MKTETGRISSLQYMFCIACFIQSSALLSSFFVPLTKQDSWMSVLAGILLASPLLMIYLGLMRRFPGKTLIEINEAVFGRVFGFVVSLLYIWFMMSLFTLNLLDIGQLVKKTIMVDTPLIALISLCILVCAYAVYHGIRVVARYSFVFALLAVFVVITSTLFTLNFWRFENFLPMFDQSVMHYVQSMHLATTIPFGEVVVFLMIAPYVQRNKKGLARYAFGGLLIGGMTVLGVVVRDTAVLGNVLSFFSIPPFETQRMAVLAEGLNRLEILYIIILIVLLFFKVLILYYVSVMAVTQLFKLGSHRLVIPLAGALCVAYATFIYPSEIAHVIAARGETAQLWTVFQLCLPLFTLIVSAARKPPKKQSKSAEAA